MAEEKEVKIEEKKEEKKEEITVPAHLKSIVKEIEEMKLIDLAKLVEILEEKFGVSAMPIAMATGVGGGAAQAGASEAEEEKSAYSIVLTDVGEKKIEVIKVVKKITKKGLKDCKDIVDAASTEAQVIKDDVKKEEAEEMKKEIEAAGAKVELK